MKPKKVLRHSFPSPVSRSLTASVLGLPILGLSVLAVLAGGCSGGKAGSSGESALEGTRASLVSQSYGRLVDIYAYRRNDATAVNRLDATRRSTVRVSRDVLINPGIEGDDLSANPAAVYHFLQFDPVQGHDSLLILWDDQNADERAEFERALAAAKSGLIGIPDAQRDQNTLTRPMPVVPRDAVIQLKFDKSLGQPTDYFAANPSAIQVLQVVGDPKTVPPQNAYVPLGVRIIANGDTIIIDPTLIGQEVGNGQANPNGLPASPDLAANVRIAIPTSGVFAKSLRVQADHNAEFNSIDASGNAAVIRDFRVANRNDGSGALLPDTHAPQVVADLTMGITSIDAGTRLLVLDKRGAKVAVRGRIPFVDGVKDPNTGLPLGKTEVPTSFPLRHGDLIFQDVVTPSGESVRLSAEVIENLDIGSVRGGSPPPGRGNDAAGDSSSLTSARVIVSTLYALDSKGNRVDFQSNTDCTVWVHYHDQVPLTAGGDVGDASRRPEFMRFDPFPPPPDRNRNVSRFASIMVRFSEPIDLSTVKSVDNFAICTISTSDPTFLKESKPGALSTIPARRTDQDGSSTLVRLTPPLGLFHVSGTEETYYFHLLDGEAGLRDLAGNRLDLNDIGTNVDAFTVQFRLASTQDNNLVGFILRRFNSDDEDGTKPGIQDGWGQFQLVDGALQSFPTVRFSRGADTNLQLVTRGDKGECDGAPPTVFQLWQTDTMNVGGLGGILEPQNPKGSRLQMCYREDDFQLSYHEASDMEIDVEQMAWSEFVANQIVFDQLDRYTLLMSHSEYRPDIFVANNGATPARCVIFPQSYHNIARGTYGSGLHENFAGNVLGGTAQVEVVKDKVYQINPNNAFIGVTTNRYLHYPKFARSYTWRDRRLMGINPTTGVPTGMCGAHDPNNPDNSRKDFTASVSSPWVPNFRNFPAGYEVVDTGDFLGSEKLDHASIASPLLLDFLVYPDDPDNGVASGANLFQIGYHGPLYPAPGHGYYNANLIWNRVHSSGGINNLQVPEFVDPRNTFLATGGWIQDPLLGLFRAQAGDDHIHWAQADFVRRVSVVTYGYVDTLLPNRHDFLNAPWTNWPGKSQPNGLPQLTTAPGGIDLRAAEFDVFTDPPPTFRQPGTRVIVEFSALNGIAAPAATTIDTIYDPSVSDKPYGTTQRGNLLNPNFACEAYRYIGARVAAPQLPRSTGLTNYAEDPNALKGSNGLIPRYINWRITMENNINVTPAVSPRLETFALTYRVRVP